MTSKTNRIKKAAAGILAAAVVACGMPALDGVGVMPETGITAYAASTTVRWNNDDITGNGNSFTKDGVTITAGSIDFRDKNFMGGGTFTTTLGKFTRIEVTASNVFELGTGWSGNSAAKRWTGNASSVSFSGGIMGRGKGNTKFVFTIELPTVPATATYSQVGEDYPAQFAGDDQASLWLVNVTAGKNAITSLDVQLDSITSVEKAQTLETPAVTNGTVVLGVVTNLTAAEVRTYGGFTVFANEKAIQTNEIAAD